MISHDLRLWQKSKDYYSFGEEEEFECFTGFELEGYQFFNCRPDGTWSKPSGQCVSKSGNDPVTVSLKSASQTHTLTSVILACRESLPPSRPAWSPGTVPQQGPLQGGGVGGFGLYGGRTDAAATRPLHLRRRPHLGAAVPWRHPLQQR